jgi:C4-dicarboxylate transporter DctM subunit
MTPLLALVEAEPVSGTAIAIILGVTVLFILVGSPLFVTLGVIAALCFWLLGEGFYERFEDFRILIKNMVNLTTKNVLLAIPFFVVSGSVMSAGTIAARLVNVAKALFGWLPGGLAIATVGGCIFFAAISGSSPVTVIAIGSVMFPALLKAQYREEFSLGLLTSAGSLGIVIPPSIPMLVYALVGSAGKPIDVGEMFMSGILPGIFIGGLLALWSVREGVLHKAPRDPFSWPGLGTALRDGAWALGLPVLILGGIYPIFGGRALFTPTEAAAVSVVYALAVELLIHRDLKLREIPKALVDSGVAMGALLAIMTLAFGLNEFLVERKVPDLAAEALVAMKLTPATFLLALNVLLLFVGALMDSISAILILAPLIVPISNSLGIDPVHLGIVFIINLEIGYLTPPIGVNLFVAASVFGKPLGQVVKGALPFIAIMAAGMLVVTYLPTLSMGPVNVVLRDKGFYEPFPTGRPVEAGPGKVQTIEEMMRQMQQRKE